MSQQAEQASPVTVAMVDVTEPMGELRFLPYGSGLLQMYVQVHAPDPERYRFLLPQCLRRPIEQAVERLAQAQVVGFSVYVWNQNYNLLLAQALKAAHPEILIVFGGPQVPDRAQDFLAQYPFVDLCVHGEGEVTFLKMLEAHPGHDWESIPGISYLQGDCFVSHPRAARLAELDQIPSPFLGGYFEPLMAAHPEIGWASVWETNRGCPFSCSFCDWGSNIASKVKRFGEERLTQEIDWFARHKIDFIYCCDANFGILPRDLEIAQALAAAYQRAGYPRRVVTQMTKNQSERAYQAHRILREAGVVTWATLSLQSVSPAVLKAIRRDNISLEAYHDILQRLQAERVPHYTDLLLGLPEESFDSFLDGIDAVIGQGQHYELRIYNVHVLPNAELGDPAYRERYGIETVAVPCHPPDDPVIQIGGIHEHYEMVVGTRAMPHSDWLRAQALVWWVQLLYYSRLLQMSLLVLQAISSLTHRELLLAFAEAPLPPDTDFIHFFREFFLSKAADYAQGLTEYSPFADSDTGQPRWILPPAFAIAQLLMHQQFGTFYQEAQRVLSALCQRQGILLPPGLLKEALQVNEFMYLQNFRSDAAPYPGALRYNLVQAYYQIRHNQPFSLTDRGQVIAKI